MSYIARVAGLTIVSLTLLAASDRTDSVTQGNCGWCTTNEFGTEHRTDVSFGFGIIKDPHGWNPGDCGAHTGCGVGALPAPAMERLVALASAGDLAGLRAVVRTDATGRVQLGVARDRVNILGCEGRIQAVIWIDSAKSAAVTSQ